MLEQARLPSVGVDDASEAPQPLPQRRPAAAPSTGLSTGPAPGLTTGPAPGLTNGQLPRRPSRVPAAGRHRSPHRLTLPPDAPPLVIAIAGAACPSSDELGADIADAVGVSCPGATIRLAYLDGADQSLSVLLGPPDQDEAPPTHPAIIVPLLTGPHPLSDAVLTNAVATAAIPVILTGPLGPHPLIAEALHTRLAEAGLARAARTRGLSVSSPTSGVIVLADRGPEAAQAAEVAAVLLASRIAAPVAAASLGDQASVDAAIARLHAAGASELAVAPCVIGPETDPGELAAACEAIGAEHSAALSAHPAISQLVAMRYGAALADRRLAG
jgi:hypothetical protein